jgi:hypothetical protein
MTKQNKDYFTDKTEAAIVKYNNTEDTEERSKIYEQHIHKPFQKLVESIMNRFGLRAGDESIKDLQQETINLLVQKLHRFDPSSGKKAYSYFGTVTKRYLIARSRTSYKRKIKTVPVDPTDFYEPLEEDGELKIAVENRKTLQTETIPEGPNDFLDYFAEYCVNNLEKLFKKQEDRQVALAVLELFRQRDSIQIFEKKALYLYIREIVDVKTITISRVAKELGKIYKKYYQYYLEHDIIKLPGSTFNTARTYQDL